MSQAIDLVRAVLAEKCSSDRDAICHLDRALVLEVDPLLYFVHRFGLDEALVYRRAARWAQLDFLREIPQDLTGEARFSRLDALGEARSVRADLSGCRVTYAAPSFAAFLGLAGGLKPELRQRLRIVPLSAVRAKITQLAAPLLLDYSRQRLARRWPFASASFDLPLHARVGFVAILALLVIMAAAAPFTYKPALLFPLALLLLPTSILRLIAACTAEPPHQVELLPDEDLPVYSVLIPLRDEANMVPLLHQAMLALDYPASKLDIKFIVEASSKETVVAVRELGCDPRFQLIEVPEAPPTTKPKALNYALPMVHGEHAVIYDAEDIPDPLQLRLAASRFAADPTVDCLQAELGIDNASETWMTALFAGEYAGLFGRLLPLLARRRFPVPLGGTSNHFRTTALREVGGWDAFNVTEDADLGIRLARLRYRTGTLRSRTGEEAPITLNAWMAQRTRWIKGWMQCFIVHNRSPAHLLRDMGWRAFLAFEIYVGGLILSAPLHTVFTVTLLLRMVTGAGWPVEDAWDVAYLLVLLLGYGGSAALIVVGLIRTGERRLLIYQLMLPIYWVLHSAATVRACQELLVRPYFWAKTAHGRTRLVRGG